jgi:hypothetical protein
VLFFVPLIEVLLYCLLFQRAAMNGLIEAAGKVI